MTVFVVLVVADDDIVVADDVVAVEFRTGHCSIMKTTIEVPTGTIDLGQRGPATSLDPLGIDTPCRRHRQRRRLWPES